MSLPDIQYRERTASREDIWHHLIACDGQFIPPLSSSVSIHEYSNKLFEKACTFEAWHGRTLVGLVAAYLNDTTGSFGFISNVSVLQEYAGAGMASDLLRMCVEKAREIELSELRLEVAPINPSAINLYHKLKFIECGCTTHFTSMRLTLQDTHHEQ